MGRQEHSPTSALTLESELKLMALAAPSEKLTALVQYSAGRIPRRLAMDSLGITDYGELLQAMSSVGLPRPILNQATREEMINRIVAMVGSS